MKNKPNKTSNGGGADNQALFNNNSLLWTSAIGRRAFLKKTGAASVASLVVLEGLRVDVFAAPGTGTPLVIGIPTAVYSAVPPEPAAPLYGGAPYLEGRIQAKLKYTNSSITGDGKGNPITVTVDAECWKTGLYNDSVVNTGALSLTGQVSIGGSFTSTHAPGAGGQELKGVFEENLADSETTVTVTVSATSDPGLGFTPVPGSPHRYTCSVLVTTRNWNCVDLYLFGIVFDDVTNSTWAGELSIDYLSKSQTKEWDVIGVLDSFISASVLGQIAADPAVGVGLVRQANILPTETLPFSLEVKVESPP